VLEPYDGKLSRTVLRGEGSRKAPDLPGITWNMKVDFYPLAASKMLRHCEIFISTMRSMESDELVELAFNEFIATSDRTLQYLGKELNKVGGNAPNWFHEMRDNLPDRV